MDKERFNELLGGVSPSIRMKLDYISKFLYLGKASVIVGAGFSRNAEMDESISMKDWGQLTEYFYQDLYGDLPSDEELKLKSSLKLASQVECSKGRAALDELIIKSLPDASIRPGVLHHKLVSLNWRDIFTTNYDTLLERAAIEVFKSYNVVTSKDSLLYKQSPRIVKLHGSFGDSRPFIISEEDYRTYPQKFPEYVNTVRQALIESIVCLFGFSGDDPNFLSWIGWIRDVMGDKLSPIYLFSAQKEIHDSEIQLFRNRKIEIIKLYDLGDIKSIHEGFDFVFSYLSEEFRPKIEWSGKLQNSDCITDVTKEMKRIRMSYPGWLLLPADKLKDFEDLNSDFPFLEAKVKSLADHDKLEFLYELDWRLTIAFMPKFLSVDWYRSELEYLLEIEDKFKDDHFSMLLTLKCSLLSIYRHIGDSERFDKLVKDLDPILENNGSSFFRRVSYEKCLKALGELDYNKIRSVLTEWDVNDLDYLGSIWKANVLVEIGEKDQGTMLLDTAFNSVRTMLLNDSESTYHRSAFIILNDCIALYNRRHPKANTDYSINLKMSDYIDFITKKFSKDQEQKRNEVTHDFNIGSFGTQWKTGPSGYLRKYSESFRYLIICENYGYSLGEPYRSININILQLIFPYIAESDINYALSSLVRSSNNRIFGIVCSRKNITSLSSEIAKKIFDHYLTIWNNIDNNMPSDGQLYRFKNIVFPLLSILCIKIDPERIIKFVSIYFNFSDDRSFKVKYLITAYYSLSKEDLNRVAYIVYSMPIKINNLEHKIPLPSVSAVSNWEVTDDMIKIIHDGILDSNEEIRRAAYYRMEKLYSFASEHQKTELNDLISSWREKFSGDTDILYSYRLQYSDTSICPESAKPIIEFIYNSFIKETYKYINSSIPIQNFGRNLIPIVNFLDWFTIDQIQKITDKIILFLEENFEIIQEDDSNELFGGLREFSEEALITIFAFCMKIGTGQLDPIKNTNLINILTKYSNDFSCSSALANLFFLSNQLPNKKKKLIEQINKNISSTVHYKVHDSFKALSFINEKLADKAGIQEIIAEVIYGLKYKIDKNSSNQIIGLIELIKVDAIRKKNLDQLEKFLSKIDLAIIDVDIPDEFKTDILYNIYRLVGVISVKYKDGIFTDVITKWKTMANDTSGDNDIRQGFQDGIYEAS